MTSNARDQHPCAECNEQDLTHYTHMSHSVHFVARDWGIELDKGWPPQDTRYVFRQRVDARDLTVAMQAHLLKDLHNLIARHNTATPGEEGQLELLTEQDANPMVMEIVDDTVTLCRKNVAHVEVVVSVDDVAQPLAEPVRQGRGEEALRTMCAKGLHPIPTPPPVAHLWEKWAELGDRARLVQQALLGEGAKRVGVGAGIGTLAQGHVHWRHSMGYVLYVDAENLCAWRLDRILRILGDWHYGWKLHRYTNHDDDGVFSLEGQAMGDQRVEWWPEVNIKCKSILAHRVLSEERDREGHTNEVPVPSSDLHMVLADALAEEACDCER